MQREPLIKAYLNFKTFTFVCKNCVVFNKGLVTDYYKTIPKNCLPPPTPFSPPPLFFVGVKLRLPPPSALPVISDQSLKQSEQL